ncbi:MAG TPA: GtrA family protein [Ktedonobacteraceae bacterium]|nr:GtrA family protein [Ktedonobacteraceae bacterium]
MTETEAIEASEESPNKTQDADNHRFHRWRSTFWQFLRYCLVGGANTTIDLLTLNIFLWRFPTNNVQVLVLYNAFAYTSGALSSFVLNKNWTFRRRQRTTSREVVRFAISLLLEVLYSSALIWLAARALQPLIANPTLWGNASKLIAVAVGTVISYSFMRFWIFAAGPQDRPAKQEIMRQAPTGSENNQASNGPETAHKHTIL